MWSSVRITTLLQISVQITDGDDYRVLISPLPPERKESIKEEVVVKTDTKVQKKTEKKVVKLEVKGKNIDERLVLFISCKIKKKNYPDT